MTAPARAAAQRRTLVGGARPTPPRRPGVVDDHRRPPYPEGDTLDDPYDDDEGADDGDE